MSSSETPQLPFPLRLDSIDSWLADLPVTNSRECCRILYAGLQALNGNELDPPLRLQALERFRPLVVLQARNLIPYFVGKPLPLGEKIRKLAKLSAQFHAELAKGYETIAKRDNFAELFEAKEQATIIHRALQSYELLLLHLAHTYEMPSSSIAEKLDALYRLAEAADVHNLNLNDPDCSPNAASSISDLFKRIQAFRLAAPNRLSQEDIRQYYDLLRQYDGLIHLGRNPGEAGGQAELSVDPNSGRVPHSPIRVADNRGNIPQVLFGAFVGKLDALRQPTVPAGARLNESLSVYLQVRLGAMPPLMAGQKSRNAVLILGFDVLVLALAKLLVKSEHRASWADMTELELVPLSDHTGAGPGLESSKSAGTFTSAPFLKKSVKPQVGGDIWSQPMGEFPCQVHRTEAPGYYLLDHAAGALRVGRLVGLNTDNKLIQIGRVCGSGHEGARSFDGFELLASDVNLARIFCDTAPQIGRQALFVKAAAAGKECYGLILPPLKLRSGEGLAVELDGRREKYRIAKLLEATSEFSQFEIVREDDTASG
ncbi:MAG TPA: hypothetical protein VLU73_15880 [Methylococcaceae bacterium]|jgi:hypothetical protein|nr:hypothetical protein [Methylococcaceae bacterium]